MLTWARVTIGLSQVAAARKIDVPDDRVEQWEAGTAQPTLPQLRRASTVYRRPLAVFFLSEPPADFDTMRDFRRLEGAGAAEWSPELHSEYRRALDQRQALLDLAEIEDVEPLTTWRLESLPPTDEALAARARDQLLAPSPLPLPTHGDQYEHLNAWIAALEEAGVLVMATMGGRVSTKEARAFSLHFDVVPVIVVNGSDFARGRLFSLLHEYAHLLLHTGGVCDTTTDLRATNPDRRLEARCNALAAEMLMPRAQVLAQRLVLAREHVPASWDYATLREAAAPFGVSAEAFLRRLVTLGRATSTFYEERREEFLAAYDREELRQQGGGNWYRNMARDLGKGFVRRVTDAHGRRVIDSYTATSFLDVKTERLPRLAEAAALSSRV